MSNATPLTPLKVVPTLVAVIVTLLIWFVVPVPEGVAENAWQLLALFVGTIVAIIGKAMPIGSISIVAIALVALTQVTNPGKAGPSMSAALSGFSNSLIWLIGIAVLVSQSLTKTGLGARLSYYFISAFGKKTIGIAYSFAFAELVLSPITPSNTARGGAILHPIMRSISTSFDSMPNSESSRKMGRYLALTQYNLNALTSAFFITATAPNTLIARLLNEGTQGVINLSWGEWAIAALVPGIVALLVLPLVVYFMYPPQIKHSPDAPKFAREKLQELGPMSLAEKITLGVFLLLLLLWAGVPAMILGKAFAVNGTAAAFIGLSILLCTGVLSWDDVLNCKGAWDTITWFAALVMMATYLGKLGITTWMSASVSAMIADMGFSAFAAMAALVVVYLYAHYMFASATAHVTAMFAAFLGAGLALGVPIGEFSLLLAFSSGLMMAITHYGTGTGPIIYGSGYTTLGEWWISGFVCSAINLAIFFVIGGFWWSFLGY